MPTHDQPDYRSSLTQMTWNEVAPGLRVKAHKMGNRQFRLLEFTGSFYEVQWCMEGHCGYVLEGEIVVNIDGSLVTFRKGDAVNIPGKVRHRHHATEQTATLFLIEEQDVVDGIQGLRQRQKPLRKSS